jgi:hypothetical protein
LLTLLNGPRSIHLRSISRSILDTQKTWNFKDYTVKYRDGGFIVLDSSQKNVYCNNSSLGQLNHDLIKYSENEETAKNNVSLIEEIDDFSKAIDEKILQNHFIDSWPTADFSFLLLRKQEFNEEKTYEQILDSYNNNSDIDDIWTGRFSISFIKKLQNDIGFENLRVLNFIRNPSSCLFTNYLDEDCKMKYGNISILNMIFLKNLPEVINVNYEEYMTNGKFLLNGLEIPLPSFIVNYNNLISEYEMSKYDSNLITEEMMEEFNQSYKDFEFNEMIKEVLKSETTPEEEELYNEFVVDFEEKLDKTIIDEIPKNIFQDLNYSSLSLEQIISK